MKLLTFWTGYFCVVWGCPVPWGCWADPWLLLAVPVAPHSTRYDNQKCLQALPNVLRVTSPLDENHIWYRDILCLTWVFTDFLVKCYQLIWAFPFQHPVLFNHLQFLLSYISLMSTVKAGGCMFIIVLSWSSITFPQDKRQLSTNTQRQTAG